MNIRIERTAPSHAGVIAAGGSMVTGGPDITVFLSGDLDIYSAASVASALTKAIKDGARDLLVDLSDVHHVDMAGLGTLVRALKQMQEYGGSILLTGADAGITKILNVTGLVRIFPLYDRNHIARDGDAA